MLCKTMKLLRMERNLHPVILVCIIDNDLICINTNIIRKYYIFNRNNYAKISYIKFHYKKMISNHLQKGNHK